MSLMDWLRSSATPAAPPRRRSPFVEVLEERRLLAAPSGLEQELLEWINHFRTQPGLEFDRLIRTESPPTSNIPGVTDALQFFGVSLTQLRSELNALPPAPPLAWNSALNEAALGHNQAMISADTQSHQLPGEPDLATRITNAGYTGWTVIGENIYAFAESVAHAHAGFVIDWGNGAGGMQPGRGHRVNLMDPGFREVGLAVTPESDPNTQVGPLVVTEDFANRSSLTRPYLLGVVWADTNANDMYTAGEGLGGVTVTAIGPGGTFTTTTFDSGGYQMLVPPGTYQVTFSGGSLAQSRMRTIAVGSGNTKLDLDTLSSDPIASFARFESTVVAVREGSAIDLTLLRQGDTTQEAALELTVGPGTSATWEDFNTFLDGEIVRFAPGQTRATVRIDSRDDTRVESTETLVLAIQPLQNIGTASNARVTVMIDDNDKPPATPVTLVSARAAGQGPTTRTISLRLGGDLDARTVLNTGAYVVKRSGRDRKFGTRDDGRVAVSRVSYNRSTHVVSMTLARGVALSERLLLAIRPNTILDTDGHSIAGASSILVTPGMILRRTGWG
jgi:uncharacterized protein YkwD